MTRPKIKVWDVSQPADWDGPAAPTCFSELFMFAIGPDEEFPDGREWFDIEVVTPSYLAAQLAAGAPYFFTRGMLVVERWDPDRVVQAMQAACDAVPEGDWSTIVEYLSRYTWYEYDGSQLKLNQRVPDAALSPLSESGEAKE